MKTLEESRARIDEIDEQLVKLFEERFHIVEDVASYKKKNQLPILDSKREERIIEKNVNRLEKKQLAPYFKEWYLKLLELSKQYQEERNS